MTKRLFALLLAVLLCAAGTSVQADQMLSIYLDKEAVLAHDTSAADIRIHPEGMVCVTRHSLWPWDEDGTKWSMFVEIENISDERIAIDEDWLIACKANREEIASASYIFDYTAKQFDPGEKIVLHIGAYPYVQAKRNAADTTWDTWDVDGMSDFASSIRRAKALRICLDTRGDESSQNWPVVEIEPKIWIDKRIIHFEWTNETGEMLDFRTIGAVVSDGEGRVIDVIRSWHTLGAAAAPGETLTFEKEISPYITQEMIDGALFEAFAYKFAQPL